VVAGMLITQAVGAQIRNLFWQQPTRSFRYRMDHQYCWAYKNDNAVDELPKRV